MDKKAETIATYDATAERMAEKFRTIGARTSDIEKAFELVGIENPYVLEIGCGDGRDAKEIIKRTSRYVGMDVSESMIRIASQYVPQAKFERHDIETYRFPKEIDIIFSFASLLHSDKRAVGEILHNALGALNPGGIFYISLKFDEYREETKTDEFGTRTYYFYTPELIKELAGEQWEVVSHDAQEMRGQKWFTIALRKL